jgi:iron complex outermembrane receptor protein
MKTALRLLPFLCAAGVVAQPAAASASPHIVETVIVRAHPLPAEQLAQSYRVLSGDELARKLDGTIGSVVGQLPGVGTTSFGQAVGRPVIHGLGGPRVRVMEDHIPSLDASTLSEDHAVTIEPFLADSIDILKGPATLIYGSGAIGGVVDVHTGRIPQVLPAQYFSGDVEARIDDVADQRTGAARFDGAAGQIAWHVDMFSRRLKDYDIPGYAQSAALRRLDDDHDGDHDDDHDDDHEDHNEAVRGTLPNSDLRTTGGALGMSYIGDRGFIGMAVSRYESKYGLPGGTHAHHHDDHDHDHHDDDDHGLDHHGHHDHDDEDDDVRLELKQTRWDLAAGLQDPFVNFTELKVRIGYNDYEHRELESRDEIASRYEVRAWEGRIEALHAPVGGWQGVLGLQVSREDFESSGEEAFAPPSDTDAIALFIVEERPFEGFTLQAGARYEHTEVDAGSVGSESFDTLSASVGAVVPLAEGFELGLIADLAQRAPVAAELYSDGPHLATQAYEIGDPDLDIEQAANLSATLRYGSARLDGSATLYFTRFKAFIFQADTGAEEDGLPVRIWAQEDADFRGVDLEARYRLLVDGPVSLEGRVFYDLVRAELDVTGNDRIPRLPPDRAGIGFESRWQWLTANVDYLRVFEQSRTAAFERDSDAYDDLRVQLSGRFDLAGAALTVFLQGRNLTDDEQRNHVSSIKDYAPLAGRTVLAGMRLSF